MNNQIITVGICPCWDLTSYIDGVEWGQHKVIYRQTNIPAGKPLNVSKALAFMSVKSTAAGLWGDNDYQQLVNELSDIGDYVDLKMTIVEGATRQNITVVDTKGHKELHLRAKSGLTTHDNLKSLEDDLEKIINPGSIVVFAGSMPDEPFLDDSVKIIKSAVNKKAKVVIDTSGIALERIVESGGIHIIKPNLEELSQLLNQIFNGNLSIIVEAARTLCDKVEIILLSMGGEGALVITKDIAIHCKIKPSEKKIVNTVSCGDYLLGGFLSQPDKEIDERLQIAVKLATLRALGLTDKGSYCNMAGQIELELNRF